MKSLLLTTAFIPTICGAASAQAPYAMLRLRLSDRTPIAASVDGRYYDRGTTSLTLDGLRPGPHRITVFSAGAYGGRPVRIYTGTIEIDAGVRSSAVVDVYRRSLRLRSMPADRGDSYGNDNNDYARPPADGRNETDPVTTGTPTMCMATATTPTIPVRTAVTRRAMHQPAMGMVRFRMAALMVARSPPIRVVKMLQPTY